MMRRTLQLGILSGLLASSLCFAGTSSSPADDAAPQAKEPLMVAQGSILDTLTGATSTLKKQNDKAGVEGQQQIQVPGVTVRGEQKAGAHVGLGSILPAVGNAPQVGDALPGVGNVVPLVGSVLPGVGKAGPATGSAAAPAAAPPAATGSTAAPAAAPSGFVVRTFPASGIGSSSAVMNGYVSYPEKTGRVWFEFGETQSLGRATNAYGFNGEQSLAFPTGGGLKSKTAYYYRPVAESGGALVYGETVSFTTQ